MKIETIDPYESFEGTTEISRLRLHFFERVYNAARAIVDLTESGDLVFAETFKQCECYDDLVIPMEYLEQFVRLEDQGFSFEEIQAISELRMQVRQQSKAA